MYDASAFPARYGVRTSYYSITAFREQTKFVRLIYASRDKDRLFNRLGSSVRATPRHVILTQRSHAMFHIIDMYVP